MIVIPNEIADENHLISLFSSSGRITYSSSQFLRFSAKSFIKDEGVLESKDRLQDKIRNFSHKTQVTFKENLGLFTEMTGEILRAKKFIYEEDLTDFIFKNNNNNNNNKTEEETDESISNRFAVHKFLFQGHEWIKDGQWSVGHSGSGPYIYRPIYQLNLLSQVTEAMNQSGFDVDSFREKMRRLVNGEKMEIKLVESEYLVLKCLKVFANELYLNALPTVSNPFRVIVKEAFLGVAILDTQTDAKKIMEAIKYDNIMRKEKENIKCLSKHLNNSYLIDDLEEKEGFTAPNIATSLSSSINVHDFMDLPVYLIDPPGTTEVDDGISLEYDASVDDGISVKLHVHTADPSDFIGFNDKIDLMARSRAESLYLTELKKSMLPSEITTMSTLKINKSNSQTTPSLNTLSFSCTVNLDNGHISNHQIRRGIMKNLKHMTYEEAELLSSTNQDGSKLNSDMMLLKRVAKAHLNFRKEGGYIDFSYPKGIARITDENEIVVDIENNTSESSTLNNVNGISCKGAVAEAMIIAGRIAGEYLRERNIAGPFRYHPGIIGGVDQLVNKDTSAMNLLEKLELMKKLPTGAVDLHPRPHLSMGIEAYVKVTSPLRRYLDLVTHKILKKEIDSKHCEYGKNWFMQHLYPIHRQEQYNRKLSGSVNKYWIEEYLKRMKSSGGKDTWTLIPLEKIRDDFWNVHIEEVATNFIVQLKTKSVGSISLGEPFPARFVTKESSKIITFEQI